MTPRPNTTELYSRSNSGADFIVQTINDLFQLTKRLGRLEDSKPYLRYIERITERLEDLGFEVINPLGEAYSETRTDCDASISGEECESLVIEEVIKPIIRVKEGSSSTIIQRARVIVSAKA
jgi:hypothetical protein